MTALPSLPTHAPSTAYSSLQHASYRASFRVTSNTQAGPSRAVRRSLMGSAPSGAGQDIESSELSDEEWALDHEQSAVRQFGHRFLVPIGREQTQYELDAAASPTPSEPEHERRQEDRNAGSESVADPSPNELEVEEAVVDLDNSVEDMDADGDASELTEDASELTEDGIPTESEGSIEDGSVMEAMEDDVEDMSFV